MLHNWLCFLIHWGPIYVQDNSPFWGEEFCDCDKHIQSCNQDTITIKIKKKCSFSFYTNPTKEALMRNWESEKLSLLVLTSQGHAVKKSGSQNWNRGNLLHWGTEVVVVQVVARKGRCVRKESADIHWSRDQVTQGLRGGLWFLSGILRRRLDLPWINFLIASRGSSCRNFMKLNFKSMLEEKNVCWPPYRWFHNLDHILVFKVKWSFRSLPVPWFLLSF